MARSAGANYMTVLKGSTLLWRKSLGAVKATALKAGKSLERTALWNGKPNQGGLKNINPGTYTIQVYEGGYSASNTIRIR